MDKYEFKLKVDEMKALVSARNYNAAAEIAETINWRKIRNLNALVLAGEVFEQVERYEDSKEILLMAYDKSPIGRNIIYRLAEIAIKTRNFEEAQEYYDEFVDIAPHDNLKFVLKYKMTAAQGLPYKDQINILEELKEQEYSEEWAYELAYLYHRDKQPDKCVEACDELILWFGDGIYVEKALELKMHYQPLTKSQEEKYQMFRQKRTGVIEVKPNDFLESGEIVNEPVKIPSVEMNAGRYNTANLQQEIAKGMQQIADAAGKDEVSDAMDSIKRLVEEMPYRSMSSERAKPDIPSELDGNRYQNNGVEQFSQSMHQILHEDPYRQNYHMVRQDQYGQIDQSQLSQNQGQHRYSVSQVSQGKYIQEEQEPIQLVNQMSIEEILAEWEKTKQATQEVLQETEEHKFEEVKERVLLDAEKLMERLMNMIPQLTSGAALQGASDLSESQSEGVQFGLEEAGRIVAGMNKLLQEQIDSLTAEQSQEQTSGMTHQQSQEQVPISHRVSDPTRKMPKLPDYIIEGEEPVLERNEIEGNRIANNMEESADVHKLGTQLLKEADNQTIPVQQADMDSHLEQMQEEASDYQTTQMQRVADSQKRQQKADVNNQSEQMQRVNSDSQEMQQRVAADNQVGQQKAVADNQSEKIQGADRQLGQMQEAEAVHKIEAADQQKPEVIQNFKAARREMIDAMREVRVEYSDMDGEIKNNIENADLDTEINSSVEDISMNGRKRYAADETGMSAKQEYIPENAGQEYHSENIRQGYAPENAEQKYHSENTAKSMKDDDSNSGLKYAPERTAADVGQRYMPEDLKESTVQRHMSEDQENNLRRKYPEDNKSMEGQEYPARNPDVDLRQEHPSDYTDMDKTTDFSRRSIQTHTSLTSRPKFRTQAQIQEEELSETDHKEEIEEFSEEDMAAAAQAAGFYQEAPKSNVLEEEQDKYLSPEQRQIFSYFVLISGMETQIYDLLKGVSEHLLFDKNSLSGNIIVEGIQGSGKTVLIKNIIMSLQRQVKRPNGKIGKIDANVLNQKDMEVLAEKVSGGCLIIESAGKISRDTAVKLSQCMEKDHTGTLYILEDTKQGIKKALERDSSFAAKFTEKITIPLFTNDELVAFGRAYANDLDYDIDEMGVLALYKRINSIQKLDHVTTLTEVKEIVDEAIENAEKGVLKKVFGILTSTRANEENYVILREKDFEE